jgi:hypothetical protein
MTLLPCIFEAIPCQSSVNRAAHSLSSGDSNLRLTRTRAFRPGMQIELQPLQKERFNAGSL